MAQKPHLSIIIPNYNEKENLQSGVLDQVNSYLKQADFTWEVIISDDASTDGSLQIIQDFAQKHPNFKVLKNRHGGKAWAINQGIKKARGQTVLFTDMDQSTPLKEVEKLLPFYDQGFDLVFGSRGATRDASIFRRIVALGFLTIRRSLLLPSVVDTQCGFKSLKTPIAQKIFPQLEAVKNAHRATGWVVSAFDVELLFLAKKYGYKIQEVSVNWKDRDASTSKSKNFIKESLDMLKQILKVKANDLTGKY